MKLIMDEIFEKNSFKNEIIWEYQGSWIEPTNYFPKRHQIIYFYRKSNSNKFNVDYENDSSIGVNYNRWFDYIENNKIYAKNAPYQDSRFKTYLDKFKKDYGRSPKDNDVIVDFKGSLIGDVWYVKTVDPKSKENVQYPTQKPEKLLERIIKASSNEGDIILDFFGGSGSTMAVAEKLGRKWITCDLGKLAYFTEQKRILQIQESKSLEDPKEKYGKKSKSFITASLGSYDLEKTFELERKKYLEFVSGLFEIELKKHKISGFEFEGKKDNYPVIIYDYNKYKDSSIDEDYIQDIHRNIGKKVGSRVYIIAPINFVDFVDDFIEIDDVKYYFLKIPYHIINELHKKPFVKVRQPQSKSRVNDIEEAIGFHFKRPPEVKAEIKIEKDEIKIIIKSFKTTELQSDKTNEEKSYDNFETLSSVFIDKTYNGKSFEMDEAFFADELLPKKSKKKDEEENIDLGDLRKLTQVEIPLKKTEIGDQIMIVCTDIYGNDFTQTFKI